MAKWGIRRFVSTPRKRFFIIGGVPPTAPAPGTKRFRPCASSGSWGALTGENEVSADLLGLPGEEFFMGWYVPLTTPAPGTKRCRPCASWRPWGALTGAIEVSTDLLGLPDEKIIDSWMSHP